MSSFHDLPKDRPPIVRALPSEIRAERSPAIGLDLTIKYARAAERVRGVSPEEARQIVRRAITADRVASFNPPKRASDWITEDALDDLAAWIESDQVAPLVLTPPSTEHA